MFLRLAEDKDASIWDPSYDASDDEAHAKLAFKEAGWSDDEIEERSRFDKARLASAPVTSPGIHPFVELSFAQLCDDIESAMDRLNIQSQDRVARGIEPRLGPYAAQSNVVMTDEGIVTVGAHLFRFCGLIARALVRTLNLNPYLWESPDYQQSDGVNLIARYPQLLSYWIKIFISYCLTGTHIMVPFKPATKTEVLHFEQVARAMEVFALAHEYGHHNLRHGRQLELDARIEEYEADQFSLRICYELEHRPTIYPNPYLSSGAGGVTLLLALSTLRSLEGIVGLAKSASEDSHPSPFERIRRFDSVAMLAPTEFSVLKSFRSVCERILTCVDHMVVDSLKEVPPADRIKWRSIVKSFE